MNKLQFTIGMPVRNRILFANDALQLMLKHSNYPIIVIDDASDNPDGEYLKDKRIKVICNKEKKGLTYLWNQLIRESETEYLIICSDKARVKKGDFETIEQKLMEGFGVVATNLFHIFAFSKYLTTKIGFMDEGFTNCNYEDCDLQRRLFINDIALYFTQETKTVDFASGWARNDKGENKKYYQKKWIEDNKRKTLTLLHDEKNIEDREYFKSMYKPRKFLRWQKSIITVENLRSYFEGLRFIDKRNNEHIFRRLLG